MPLGSGRLEKRTRLAVPVQIVGMDDGGAEESVITENICSRGLRVLAERPLKPSERLLVKSPRGNQPLPARVVYCERMSTGGFAVGLRLEGNSSAWFKEGLVKIDSQNRPDIYRGASSGLKVTERFTPVDANTISWVARMEDSTTWERPWAIRMLLKRDDTQAIFEYACHEGDRGLENIMRAARAEDA